MTLGGSRRRAVPRLRLARRRLPVPGHGGHLAGGGRGAGPGAAALRAGALRPADLARHGAPLRPRRRSQLETRGLTMRHILTDAAVRNAMVVHAAFGGSTNLILHLPAIAHAAGLRASHGGRLDARQPPGAAPGRRAAQRPARPSHRAGLPGRRRARGDAAPAPRGPAGNRTLSPSPAKRSDAVLDWWEQSERRAALRRVLRERDGVDPDDVIMDPDGARRRGLTTTVTFPKGNLAPGGSVIKSTAIDPSRGRCRRRLPQDAARRASSAPRRPPSPRSRPARIHAGRRAGADVPRPHGLGHGGDLPDHLGAALPGFRQSRWP